MDVVQLFLAPAVAIIIFAHMQESGDWIIVKIAVIFPIMK
jgi:hypothetical protein